MMPGRSEMTMHNQVGVTQTGMSYNPNPMQTQSIHNPVSAPNTYFSASANTSMHNIHQYQGLNPQVHQQLTPEVYGQPVVNDRDRLQMLMRDQRQIHPGYTHQMGHNINPTSLPNGHSSIPTANLVDLQGPPIVPPKRINSQRQDIDNHNRESSSSSSSTLPGQGGPIPVTVKQLEDEHRRKSVLEAASIAVSQNAKNSSESWDYVYRQLENSGYSKDQADRPDVLELLIKQLQLQKEQQQYSLAMQSSHKGNSQRDYRLNQDIDTSKNETFDIIEKQGLENFNNGSVNQRCSSSSNKPEKHEKPTLEKRSSSVASKHHNAAEVPKIKNSQQENHAKQSRPKNSSSKQRYKDERYNKPLEPPNSPSLPPQLPPKGRNLKVNDSCRDPKESANSGEESEDKWECQFCTYLNDDSIDICEMCAKSRLVSESSRTTLNSPRNGHSNRSQSALSHNSSRQTPTQGSSNAYYSDEDFRNGQSQQDRSYDTSSV